MTLFIDQSWCVSSKTDNPANGIIRIAFGESTLSLSLIDASWLAENIHREIRKVENEHPELCGLSDAMRSNLKIGDVVKVRDDAGNEADYVVYYKPWLLDSGKAVIGLKGITGGYSLDRVVKIVRFAEEPAS